MPSDVGKSLKEMFETHESDVVVVCSDGRISASKLMLAISSPFLATLLPHDGRTDLIIIEDITCYELCIMGRQYTNQSNRSKRGGGVQN